MTVAGNLKYGLNVHGRGAPFADVVDALELGQLLERRPGELSGGEHRRVAVGRALLSGARLMLMDEPLAGLDRRLAMRTLAFIDRTLRRFDVPAVYVSHSVSDVVYLCDDAWVLSAGRLVAQGPPRALLPAVVGDAGGVAGELCNLFIAERLDPPSGGGAVYRLGERRVVASPMHVAVGRRAILSVPASDVILSRGRPERISARNVLPGRVTRVVATGPAMVAFVDVGREWMVELTRSAVEELELREGVEVFAIVKASAISVVDVPSGSGEAVG